jgi:hypothetical protein
MQLHVVKGYPVVLQVADNEVHTVRQYLETRYQILVS